MEEPLGSAVVKTTHRVGLYSTVGINLRTAMRFRMALANAAVVSLSEEMDMKTYSRIPIRTRMSWQIASASV